MVQQLIENFPIWLKERYQKSVKNQNSQLFEQRLQQDRDSYNNLQEIIQIVKKDPKKKLPMTPLLLNIHSNSRLDSFQSQMMLNLQKNDQKFCLNKCQGQPQACLSSCRKFQQMAINIGTNLFLQVNGTYCHVPIRQSNKKQDNDDEDQDE